MDQKNEQKILPSITALGVISGLNRALAMEHGYLFSAAERELVDYVASFAMNAYPLSTMSGFFIRALDQLPYLVQHSFFNTMVTPNYDQIIMLRKLMIRYKIEEAVINGASQIIILGGGYDVRALISAYLYPKVVFYELDRGPTRENKLECVKNIPKKLMVNNIDQISNKITKINENLFFLDCDLSETSIEHLLKPCGFDPNKKSLIIAEGLSMYLSRENNKNLLKTVASLFQHYDSELLMSYIEMAEYYSPLIEQAQKTQNEGYQFGMNLADMIGFVRDCDLAICAKKIPTYMLDDINKTEEANYYKKNQSQQEHYFSIKKPTLENNYNSMKDVPEMEIFVRPRDLSRKITINEINRP